MKEIRIIGGGLAGLTLGNFLVKKGVPTEIIEAGRYPQHKVCGEFISGVDASILHEMGASCIIDISNHQSEMQWWMKDDLIMNEDLAKTAWCVSRFKLDQILAEQFTDLGGKLSMGQRAKNDVLHEVGVVAANGKRKTATTGKKWIGLKIHARNLPSPIGKLEMHMGTRGYIGLSEVEDGRVNCCGLFEVDQSLKGKGAELIHAYLKANGLLQLSDRMRKWDTDPQSFCATAGFFIGKQKQVGGFSIGDASAVIPPFTGNGMSMAIESAYLAGNELVQYSNGKKSWADACSYYEKKNLKLFRKRMAIAGKMHPLLFKPSGQSLFKMAAKYKVLPFNLLFNQLRTP